MHLKCSKDNTRCQVPLVMLDLFSGLGGASAAMKERGWRVLTVELNPKLKPDIVADVRHLPLIPFPIDLLWASPPCEQYSRKWQFGYWNPTAPDPDLTPWQTTLDLIKEWRPRYYCIENVRSAQKAWGRSTVHFRSWHLWTNIPFVVQPVNVPWKMGYQGNDKRKTHARPYQITSKVPYSISEAVALSIEALA